MASVPKPGAPMPPPNSFGVVQTTVRAYSDATYFFASRAELEQRLASARDFYDRNRDRMPGTMALEVRRDIGKLEEILHPGQPRLEPANTVGERMALIAERAAQRAHDELQEAGGEAAAGLPFTGPAFVAYLRGADARKVKALTEAGNALRDVADAVTTAVKDGAHPGANGAYILKRKVGGAHEDLDAALGDRHHLVADGASPLPKGKGPSIVMSPEDHAKTGSFNSFEEASAFRERQADLIRQGRFDDAFEMGVRDVLEKFPDGRYDEAIAQARQYLDLLKTSPYAWMLKPPPGW
jgi:hypothetical protein